MKWRLFVVVQIILHFMFFMRRTMTFRLQYLLFSILCVIAGIFAYLHTYAPQYEGMGGAQSSLFYPRALFGLLVIMALIMLFGAVKTSPSKVKKAPWLHYLGVSLLTCAYVLVFTTAGFLGSTAVYVFVLSFYLGYRKIPKLLAISIAFTAVVYVLFTYLLQIPLPKFGG